MHSRQNYTDRYIKWGLWVIGIIFHKKRSYVNAWIQFMVYLNTLVLLKITFLYVAGKVFNLVEEILNNQNTDT